MFEALTNCFLLEACGHAEFCAAYYMRKGPCDACSFAPQKGCDKLVVICLTVITGGVIMLSGSKDPGRPSRRRIGGGCQYLRTLDQSDKGAS